MTRRKEALIPLTHDHHHALAQAHTLINSASADDETRQRAAEAFLQFFRESTLMHVREEEEVLFPCLLESVNDAPEELVQVLIDHVRLHGMVAHLQEAVDQGYVEPRQLTELGETLRGHVRLEESRPFPLIERSVPQHSLDDLVFAPRRRD